MRTKYYAYDRWVSLFIVTCETLITGGLFYLLFLTMEDTPWHKILQAPHLQVILTVMFATSYRPCRLAWYFTGVRYMPTRF